MGSDTGRSKKVKPLFDAAVVCRTRREVQPFSLSIVDLFGTYLTGF